MTTSTWEKEAPIESIQVLKEIEVTLDKLIRNGYLFNDASCEENSDTENLQSEEEVLLDRLFSLNDILNEETKEEELRAHPVLYHSLRHKMGKFGALNKNRLKSSQERWVKQARVHRNRRKQAS